jgi:Tol biopolymer transport system component
MGSIHRSAFFAFTLLLAGCADTASDAPADDGPASGISEAYDPATDSLRFAGEVHLRNVRQLTFGGNNAEAYWSFDDDQLIFQSDWAQINPQGCDQQFLMNADGTALGDSTQYLLVSSGEGRTTCGYFLPDDRIVYASTAAGDPACPTPPETAPGVYAWPLYPDYDIYVANKDGSNRELLIGSEGYDAEPTVSPNGRYIVFTSTRSGDLDLWRYDLETGETLQLTNSLGYDGGAFFSPDNSQIVWRASRPEGEDAERYRDLLMQNLVEPSRLDIYVADADGSNVRRVTDLPGANWAPFFHPSGERIIFASNHHTEGGRLFDLFLVNLDGTGLTQVTHSGTFDAFPMFSFSGERLVFASNRNLARAPSRDTNVFVADWVETPTAVDSTFQTIEVGGAGSEASAAR